MVSTAKSKPEFTLATVEGKLLLLATVLASGLAFLASSTVGIALPTIQTSLNASLQQVSWVVNAFSFALSVLILIGGSLGDRYGRKKIFLIGIGLFSLGSLLSGTSHSILQLIIFQALEGVGAAMMVPGSLAIINTFFAESTRGKVIGLWAGLSGALAAAGPFIGGFLVQTFGFRSVFLLNIPLGLITFLITARYVPESKNHLSTKLDLPGTVLIALSLFGLSFGLVASAQQGWHSPTVVGSLLLGVISLVLFVWNEAHTEQPLVPFEIFKNPLVVGSNLTTFFLYGALSAVMFFLVLNFQQVQKLTPVIAGLTLLPVDILIATLSGPAGAWADKIGPRFAMIVGPLLVGTSMTYLAFAGTHANYFIQFLPGLMVFGLGMALVIAPLTKSALAVESKFSGAASGVNNAVSRVAGFFAVAVFSGLMAVLFSTHLTKNMAALQLSEASKNSVMAQKDKVGGIQIPDSIPTAEKEMLSKTTDDSFVYAFRRVMLINAACVFLAAGFSYYFIHNKKAV